MNIQTLLQGLVSAPTDLGRGDALLIDTGDWHKGHALAPWHKRVLLPGGGEWQNNRVQEWIDEKWEVFKGEADKLGRGARRIVILHGDLCEGSNGRNTELVTSNMALQRAAAEETARDLMRDGDVVEVIRGTPYHVGLAAESEESIAKALGCEKIEGAHSRYVVSIVVNGVRILLAHHLGQSYSPVTEATAHVRAMVRAAVNCARWGGLPPSIIGFGHVLNGER